MKIVLVILAVLVACSQAYEPLQKFVENSQMPQQCVDDVIKAMNVLKKMAGETDNKIKFALDLAVLQHLYRNKIQKSCKFLSDSNIDFKSSGVCLESAYQLSLTVQNIWQSLTSGKWTEALKDFETFLQDLPDTLDACGDHTLADKVRKDFPAACLSSFEDLGKELLVFEHNYDHLEWLVKHWKDMEKVLVEVKKACPVFA